MLGIFKKKIEDNEKDGYDLIVNVTCLLIHAARIDENYSDKEKLIIKKTLIKLGVKEEKLDEIILKSEKIEKDSNQILDYTKNIKNLTKDEKVEVIESLWEIIYSDDNSDMYETNLMRRLTGLMYLDNKVVGDIKEKIKSKINK